MKRLIEFALENGDSILVEVEEPEPEGGMVPAGSIDDLPEKAKITFQQALAKIKPVAESIVDKLRSLADPPDELEVEFGFKLNAEAGAIFAAAGAAANYKVTLKWKRQS